MRPILFVCHEFKFQAANDQAEEFLRELSKRDWEKFHAAAELLTRALLTGTPVGGRVERVAGSSVGLLELKITAPGSKGPQLRALCIVDGRLVLCVRGVDKRQQRLSRHEIELAEKAVAACREGVGERRRRSGGKGGR